MSTTIERTISQPRVSFDSMVSLLHDPTAVEKLRQLADCKLREYIEEKNQSRSGKEICELEEIYLLSCLFRDRDSPHQENGSFRDYFDRQRAAFKEISTQYSLDSNNGKRRFMDRVTNNYDVKSYLSFFWNRSKTNKKFKEKIFSETDVLRIANVLNVFGVEGLDKDLKAQSANAKNSRIYSEYLENKLVADDYKFYELVARGEVRPLGGLSGMIEEILDTLRHDKAQATSSVCLDITPKLLDSLPTETLLQIDPTLCSYLVARCKIYRFLDTGDLLNTPVIAQYISLREKKCNESQAMYLTESPEKRERYRKFHKLEERLELFAQVTDYIVRTAEVDIISPFQKIVAGMDAAFVELDTPQPSAIDRLLESLKTIENSLKYIDLPCIAALGEALFGDKVLKCLKMSADRDNLMKRELKFTGKCFYRLPSIQALVAGLLFIGILSPLAGLAVKLICSKVSDLNSPCWMESGIASGITALTSLLTLVAIWVAINYRTCQRIISNKDIEKKQAGCDDFVSSVAKAILDTTASIRLQTKDEGANLQGPRQLLLAFASCRILKHAEGEGTQFGYFYQALNKILNKEVEALVPSSVAELKVTIKDALFPPFAL